MGIALTVAGIVVIVTGLQDMFHTLLHPSGKGHMSRLVLSGIWSECVNLIGAHQDGPNGTHRKEAQPGLIMLYLRSRVPFTRF